MADGRFSLDDILNEYPKKDRPTGSERSYDTDAELEAILSGNYKNSSFTADEPSPKASENAPKKKLPAEISEQERFTHITMPIPEPMAEVPAEEAPDSVKSSLKKAFEEKNASVRTSPVKPEDSITKNKYKKDPFAELRSSGAAPKLDKTGSAASKSVFAEAPKQPSAAGTAVKEKSVSKPTADTSVKEEAKPAAVSDNITPEDRHRNKVLDEFYKSLDMERKDISPEAKAEREQLRRRADEQRIANTGSIQRAEITSRTGLFDIKDAEKQKPSEELMRSYAGEKEKTEPKPQPEKSVNQYAEVYSKRPARKPPLEKYSDIRTKDKHSDELSDIYMDKTGNIPKAAPSSKLENTIFKGFTVLFSKLKVQKEIIARREELAAAAKEPNPAELPADPVPAPVKEKSDFSDFYKEKATRTGLQDMITGFTGMLAKQNDDEPENPQLMDEIRRIKQERRGAHVAPVERSKPSDLNLEQLSDKIIPNTAKINRPKTEAEEPEPKEPEDVFEGSEEMEKAIALKKRRNKVIDSFQIRLVGDEEETPEEETAEAAEEKGSIDDFNSFDDAASINDDILQLKSTLIVRLAVLVICFLLTAYMAFANDLGLPIIQLLDKQTQTPAFVFVNSILGILAAFASYTVIACGISKLFAMKGDCDSLTAAAVVAALAQSFTMLASPNLVKAGIVHNYVPAAIGCLLFNTVGKLLIVSRTERNFRYISGTSKKCAMFMVKDEEKAQVFTRGTLTDLPSLAAMRKTEFISDFVKNSYNSDITDRFCRIFTPILIGLAVIAGAVAVPLFRSGGYSESAFYPALSVFTGTICICSCFAMMLVANLPMAAASKKLRPMQAAIIGYDSAQDFAETNSIVADAAQLFPQGMVSLYRIKIFSETRIDEAIVEAASLTAQAGSVLRNMFYDIIAGKTELLNPVESYIYEDSMGLCGWINNRRILLGNRDLMINHSIEGLPSEEKEKEYTEGGRCAVYLSISGELSAMFILDLKANIDVENALHQLEKNHIYLMLRSVDSIISINRLSEMFGVSPEMFKLIPFRLHPAYEELTEYQPKTSTGMVCSDSFYAMTSLIMGAKKLRRSVTLGICIQATAMLLGLVLVITLVCMKEFGTLSVSNTIMYNLIFLIITLISQLFNKP